MRRCVLWFAAGMIILASMALAQQSGPYKVLKAARVGGEGGWDYIYADAAGRRLYIPRRGAPNATPAVQTSVFVWICVPSPRVAFPAETDASVVSTWISTSRRSSSAAA